MNNHFFGFNSQLPKADLPEHDKFKFSANSKQEIARNRKLINESVSKRREHVKSMREAYHNYDTNYAKLKEYNDKFKQATKHFKRTLPDVSKMMNSQVVDMTRKATIHGKVTPEKLNKAASKMYHSYKGSRNKFEGKNSTDSNLPQRYSPKFYDNLIKHAAARQAKVKLQKDKNGNLRVAKGTDQSKSHEYHKKVKQGYKQQTAVIKGVADVIKLMIMFHDMYGTKAGEPASSDIIDEFESLYGAPNDETLKPERVAKVHDNLEGVF